MPTEEQAVQLLEELGLTEYEARCFVALTRVPVATASKIATLSDVPRSRVYDSVDRLHRRGLVDVQQSDPREYRATSIETAIEILRDQYESSLEATEEALSQLHKSDELEEKGAWAIADHEHVTDRVGRLLEEATDEIYVIVADEDIVDPEFQERIAAASGRGVRTLIEVSSTELKEQLEVDAPAATVVVTDLASEPASIEEKWLGRIVMVDRQTVLMDALTESARPGQPKETAIWASGPDHGLVVGVRHVLGARIDSENVFE
ncbi:helix-turn-helix domain-containing protein [Natrinema sp. 1APR25-10V2]|uniref:TrmB family transcriptional regulator n=1 Tax=Natrinema sp. 1APR25-10V2 TaxID=2951081 RepID=UPI002875556D|nr:helix-turn-helix domain-containing protein [Natrinema sp. 1APR25-10V2]MDS0476859.1 TrmB family transcriptional regulator [Natrinema sp. 1APR25-10V2]